jgi:hypothetical protein
MKRFLLFSLLIFLHPYNVKSQAYDWDWIKSVGDTNQEEINSMAVDPQGNLYMAGGFQGAVDFDPGPGVMTLTANDYYEIYISKSDISGNLIWVKQLQCSYFAYVAIAVDDIGNIFLTSHFNDTIDVDPGSGSYMMIPTGPGDDILFMKLNTNGDFLWAKSIGSPNYNIGSLSIALDTSNEDFYISGYFQGTTDFDPDTTVNYNLIGIYSSGFVAKYDSSGNFIFAKPFMGSPNAFCEPSTIVLDPSGNIYISGIFKDSIDFNPDSSISFIPTTISGYGFFICKLDNAGNFLWAIGNGGEGGILSISRAYSTTIDKSGNSYTTGYFNDTLDFDPGPGTFFIPNNSSDIFVLKLDTSGNFIWAKSVSSPLGEYSYAITTDKFANIFFVGSFIDSVDFDPGSGINKLYSISHEKDGFLASWDSSGNFLNAISCGGTGDNDQFTKVLCDNNYNSYVGGRFNSSEFHIADQLFLNADTDSLPDSYDIFYGKFKRCSASFFLYPDTLQAHHYYAVNNAQGTPPLTYDWSWGDSAHDYTAYPNHVYADSGYYTICLTITDSTGCTSTYCDSSHYLQRNTSSGSMVYINVVDHIVTQANEESQFQTSVYPNPVTNQITINSSEVIDRIEIYNAYGAAIYQVDCKKSSVFKVNIQSFTPGIYFLKTFFETGSVVTKLIKN